MVDVGQDFVFLLLECDYFEESDEYNRALEFFSDHFLQCPENILLTLVLFQIIYYDVENKNSSEGSLSHSSWGHTHVGC